MATPPPPPQHPGYPPSQPYWWGPREHPEGTTILVLGILSLAMCGLLGPFAWSMGNSATQEIDANPAAYSNRGAVQAGRICGIISTWIMIVSVGLALVFVLIAAVASASS